MIIELPQIPPSLHELYIRGRVKTNKYRAWQEICLYTLKRPKKPIQGELRVCCTFVRPSKRRMDLDNRCKAALDLLMLGGIIEDDSQVVDLRLLWATEPLVNPVKIEIEEI